jgi:DnaJ-class molecular chaperone
MTHYSVLGVPENATPEQIKKQYRKLSLELHPDRPGGDANKFKIINEAYETLSDDQRRKQYDRELHPQDVNIFDMMFGGDPFMHGMPMPGMPGMPGMPPHMNVMFQHIMKPPPMTITTNITLEQAYTGCKLSIVIERWVHHNQIKQLETETCYIDFPPGIDSNECLLLPNKGNMGPDGCLGDVRIMVQVANHSKLVRRGLDLYYTHTISLKEALCGFSFEVDYLQGKSFTINNTPGNIVQPNYKKVVPQLGMKRESSVGNLIIEFNIKFPTSLPQETLNTLSSLL